MLDFDWATAAFITRRHVAHFKWTETERAVDFLHARHGVLRANALITRKTAFRGHSADYAALIRAATPLRLSVRLPLLAQPLHCDHAFAVGRVEHDHAPCLAALDADLGDAAADQLAAVGHQHELVGFLDRERRHQAADLGAERAVALAIVHGDNAFAAAAGGAVFERGGALAVAALRGGEHELLGRRKIHIALLAKLDGAGRLLGIGLGVDRLLGRLFEAAAHRIGALQIGGALLAGGIHVAQDRE